MNTTNSKLSLRYSSPHNDFPTMVASKSSSYLNKGYLGRRVNTEGDTNPHPKYLVKKSSKPKLISSQNTSKQNLLPYRPSEYMNRISYNQHEWSHPYEGSFLQKKVSSKPLNKSNDLAKLVKGRALRKTNDGGGWPHNKKSQGKSKLFDGAIDFSAILERRTDKNYIHEKNNELKYQICGSKLLGSGTFGKVYSAINKVTKQEVAIKQVFNDKAYKNREIELMQLANSDFVVRMIDRFNTNEKSGG